MPRLLTTLLAASVSALAAAQAPVQIRVDAAKTIAPYHPIWNYFGADEPNYTYAPGGSQLLGELSAIAPATPVYFRPHNLLTSGDGSASLKWGSTNVYTEKPDGTPVYDWTLTDRLFDNLRDRHIIPMVEIGFMPEALSTHPEPYRHGFPEKPDIFTGWAYPPKDYAKWRALIVAYVQHLHGRYGSAAEAWQWEVWNEPDIPYFHGSVDEYLKLYDITTGAIRSVLPHALVGGPAVTGGGDNKHFLQLFLEHCDHGLNADSGTSGAPLDFISFHPKGSPKFQTGEAAGAAGHVRMNLGRQLALTDRGFEIIAAFPRYRATPIILSETDPEGCAACKGPQNGYRNGPLYGVSVAEMLARSAELARRRGVNLAGAVTWAFEFEDQPPFAGFRELATDTHEGLIDKPVLNVFRLFSQLSGSLVELTSSAAIPVGEITKSSVTSAPDINGIATRNGRSIDVLLWNYHDEDLPAPAASIAVEIAGIPATSVRVTHTVVDATHANAYAAWQSMGSPEHLTAAQLAMLQEFARLIPTQERTQTKSATASLTLSTELPRQAVVLYHLTW